MTTAEKIANGTNVTVLARLAMLATFVLFSATSSLLRSYVQENKGSAATAASAAASLQTHVAVLEGRQASGLRYQDQVVDMLVELQKSQVETGKQVAALAATLEAMRAS